MKESNGQATLVDEVLNLIHTRQSHHNLVGKEVKTRAECLSCFHRDAFRQWPCFCRRQMFHQENAEKWSCR